MKLASLKHRRDGQLIVVNQALSHYVDASHIAATLQTAIDNWATCQPLLESLYQQLEAGEINSQTFIPSDCASPLPRAYQWIDGSAYVNHVELVRKARNAKMPDSFWVDPLMYQGGSDAFLGPCDDIQIASEQWGIDFEAEIAVIVDDVPMGVSEQDAAKHIQLVMLVNDVSLRNLIPAELAKGFGFFQSKPSSAFSPVAVTPAMLGDQWRDGKVHLPLKVTLNNEVVGEPNAGVDMTFNFPQLIAHAALSRPLCAGTIIGSGTVSNLDRTNGSCCLAEVRMLETISDGKPSTEFMRFGDHVEIEMFDTQGESIFGKINQSVEAYHA